MSWIEDHLPNGLKDALCEPEAPAVSQPVPHPVAPQSFSSIPPTMPTVYAPTVTFSSGLSSAVASILSDLRSKTNFDATPVGQQLKESSDALADTGMSEEMKSRTAMKLSHQSSAQVVSVLQGLQAVLVSDKQHFEASMQTATTSEVSARQAKSAALQSSIDAAEAQLSNMRQEKAQVDMDLQDKQNKITNARANYAAASEARNTELVEMISHYQSIPEVK